MSFQGHRAIVAAFVAIAFSVGHGADANSKDDRREKAKEAKELAEKGQQYAMSKAQEYFAQQQYDKGMQEMQQMMQHMQSSQKNQTAKQDTTGAGKKGRGDGQGVTGPGSALRQSAQRPTEAGKATGEQRVQIQDNTPARAPLVADDDGTNDDGAPTPSEPIDTSGGDRKPSDNFVASLRELRAEVTSAEAPAAPSRGPASAPVAAEAPPASVAAAVAETAGNTTTRATVPDRVSNTSNGDVSRNWGAAVAAASGGDLSPGEEEEVDEKKIFKVRRRGERASRDFRDGTVDEGSAPPARAQIADPRSILFRKSLAKAAQR